MSACAAMLSAAGLALALSVAGCDRLVPATPAYSVTTDRPDNVVTVVVSDNADSATVEVRSQTGIGSASVASTSRHVPDGLRLRFYLSGLEELRFSYGSTTVLVSVSSAPGNEVRQAVTQGPPGAVAREIRPGDDFWMTTRIVGEDGRPASVPLTNGYIQVDAPEDYLRSGQRAFAIHWIDFYR